MLALGVVADAADDAVGAAAAADDDDDDGYEQDAHAAVTFGLLHRQIGSLDARVAETDVAAAEEEDGTAAEEEEEVGTVDSAAAASLLQSLACAAKDPPHLNKQERARRNCCQEHASAPLAVGREREVGRTRRRRGLACLEDGRRMRHEQLTCQFGRMGKGGRGCLCPTCVQRRADAEAAVDEHRHLTCEKNFVAGAKRRQPLACK